MNSRMFRKSNPMTPDEVVKNLEEIYDGWAYQNDYKNTIQVAISLIQDYQKLRERVSAGLKEIILSEMNKHAYRELVGERDAEDLSQAIVTYLQQPTEH